jgi:hypothetical protein
VGLAISAIEGVVHVYRLEWLAARKRSGWPLSDSQEI